MSTPFTEKGYEVGQVFRDTRDGELFVLDNDDGSSSPFFISLGNLSTCLGKRCTPPISKLKRIYPPEELSKDVTVTCEGHEVTISRESAIKLGLCK